MTTPNHRWGIRYSSDATHNKAYLQTKRDNDSSSAKRGELFLNEKLDEIYYVDGDGVSRKLGERNDTTATLQIADEFLLTKAGAAVPSLTGSSFSSPTTVPLTSPSLTLSGSVGSDSFSLANGKEGQVIYFIIGTLGTGLFAQDLKIKISSASYTTINGANVSKVKSLAVWRPFYDQTGNANSPTVASAIFAGGAWNLTSGYVISGIDSVSGRVVDSTGTPIAGATITNSAGTTLATTDALGIYSFSGVSGSQKIIATATGHFSTFFVPNISGAISLDFTLQTTTGIQSTLSLTGLTTAGDVTATGTARSSNNVEIVFPQNSVVNGAGTAVADAVLKVGNITVSDAGSVDVFPGYFLGDISGSNQPIESYGYLNVSLETSGGDTLALDPAIGATVRLPLDPDPVGENSIDTWKLNETTGVWTQTGTATRVGSTNVFQFNVTTFSWYNIDKPLTNTCTLTVNAWDTGAALFNPEYPSGIPAAGVDINVNVDPTFSVWGRQSIWQGRCTTDITGKCTMTVPPGYLRVAGKKGSNTYNGFMYKQTEASGGCEASINIHWSLEAETPPAVPVVSSFAGSAGTYVVNTQLSLTYATSNATTVDITHRPPGSSTATSILAGSTTTSGNLAFTPTVVGDNIFTIIATSPNGTRVQSEITLTVNATAAAEPAVTITAPASFSGTTIQNKHFYDQGGCPGSNTIPAFAWSLNDTSNLAYWNLAMYDEDSGSFAHWNVTNIPASTVSNVEGSEPVGGTVGANDFGASGYGGPCPPGGSGQHRYTLVVAAYNASNSLIAQAQVTATITA